ncbi:MAG: exodeoxyribonuclease VII small subunit [Candidimonas sp.]|nr:MAG: exodeoxyribonuclease VII small subunit [Candidimonas sp.]TAM25412.1 MAG: exodeoxyribonuclease VII small subunit [Candidimonas sp.]
MGDKSTGNGGKSANASDEGKALSEAAALPQDFETALAELEALVAQMEDGQLPLEQSLAAYEKGVELARICQQRLDSAEQQVKVLQGNLLKPLADTSGMTED